MASTEDTTTVESTSPDFGANQWLVEDLYDRYLADPDSVDAAWHDFFEDYGRAGAAGASSAPPSPAARPAAPAAASPPTP
ncbi:MAG: hypothetical protein M3140_04545, partial [Actinomycetota bacterium]|nr:hypothetical protein [Actinomycetota bacterium]